MDTVAQARYPAGHASGRIRVVAEADRRFHHFLVVPLVDCPARRVQAIHDVAAAPHRKEFVRADRPLQLDRVWGLRLVDLTKGGRGVRPGIGLPLESLARPQAVECAAHLCADVPVSEA